MTPADLLQVMRPTALRRFGNDRGWAAACGLPPETLSRLRKRESCDLRTLDVLASAVGYALAVVPAESQARTPFGREQEASLLDLCASGSLDPAVWRGHGDGFFMGGLATMLASVRGFDRRRYLALAEELHPGVTQPEVFELWLQKSPLRPARFVPMLRRGSAVAADPRAQPGYLEAFARVVEKIVLRLKDVNSKLLPIQLYVAGGAALHLHTGSRVSADIDGAFSRRVVIDDNLEVSYRDADGSARMLYFDRNYNDTLGLMHEDAHADSRRVELPGTDGKVVEVRVLTPLDLAVSKLARFSDQDREDIELLAREKLIDAKSLRKRAEEALGGYVGGTNAVRTSIDLACRLVEAARPKASGK